MFNFKSDIQRVAVSVAGTFLLTTTFVGAAIGPARAIETTPLTTAAATPDAGRVNA
ncbi:hypothetical protein IC614_06190 [Allosphingosinicella flava]|uniref:Uncharacterized protein n=1 Tax=Allosphingosinicella flava TaxID=2771430 RepID=A0A7T2GMA6_9SPHN|nr:hypothetical protein [Sphingosinicella flava]QPQ56148.1 hypothetical protein IC614_06190 [Sphingosinicella flava]